MRKKILVFSILFLVAMLALGARNTFASENVLLITNDDIMDGSTIKTVMEEISNNEITVTNVSVSGNSSIGQTVESLADSSEGFSDVIIQDSMNNNDAGTGMVAAMNSLHEKNENARFILSIPWKEVTKSERNDAITRCEKILDDLRQTITNVNLADVYGILLKAGEENIIALNDGRLTSSGELLVGCAYYRYLTGNQVENLYSYAGISDTDVETIVRLVNVIDVGEIVKKTEDTVESSSGEGEFSRGDDVEAVSFEDKSKTTTKTTKKTTTQKSESDPKMKYIRFICDREPRLVFQTTDPNYLYITVRDKRRN